MNMGHEVYRVQLLTRRQPGNVIPSFFVMVSLAGVVGFIEFPTDLPRVRGWGKGASGPPAIRRRVDV